MAEIIETFFSDNWDMGTEFVSILGSKAYYSEDDAISHAEYVTGGETGNAFYDKGVEHIQVVHYEAGEEYSYYDKDERKVVTIELDAPIWETRYYGDREAISPSGKRGK